MQSGGLAASNKLVAGASAATDLGDVGDAGDLGDSF